MKTAKFLISASIVLFTALASSAHATKWQIHNITTFKGEKEVYSVKSIRNADLIIDEKEKVVFLSVDSGVLNHIDGIKINGVLYDVTGKSNREDGWKSIVLRSRVNEELSNEDLLRVQRGEIDFDEAVKARKFDLVEKIRKAKTIELNVYWHQNRNQVMKFN